MATIRIQDLTNELRIEILGNFAGSCVDELASHWSSALIDSYHRKLIVDISSLTGYNAPGRKLLRDMCHRGTNFSATTAQSLVFLEEISRPLREGTLTLLRDRSVEEKASTEPKRPQSARAAGAK